MKCVWIWTKKYWQRDFFWVLIPLEEETFLFLKFKNQENFHNLFQKSCLDFTLTFSYSEIYFLLKSIWEERLWARFSKLFSRGLFNNCCALLENLSHFHIWLRFDCTWFQDEWKFYWNTIQHWVKILLDFEKFN